MAMDVNIDVDQTERMLSHLARLRQRYNRDDMDALERLRPAWLGLDAWDIVLEELKMHRYRERPHMARPRLVSG